MKKNLTIIAFLLLNLSVQAQIIDTLNEEASPKGGVNKLATKFFGIDFSQEQRSILEDKVIEFIFEVSEKGEPTLSEINGINEPSIIDSLKNKSRTLENFNPRIENGVAVPSIYFMQLSFPKYELVPRDFRSQQGKEYKKVKLEDFEYIKTSNSGFDLLIGGMANQFIGNPANYLGLGGGMKVDMGFRTNQKYFFGLNMSFYGNTLKSEYPLNTNREQLDAPPTLLFGVLAGKWFGNFNIQTELNTAVQNVTEKIGDNDPDWEQLKGWSPGLVINYLVKIGKGKPMYYYGTPTIYGNNINLHFGLRYLSLSISEASGFMAELGISYRMTVNEIEEYRLKD
jgi:hypothetical protein